MVRISLDDFLQEYHTDDTSKFKFVNIRGTGGSGKSTIIHELKERDPDVFEVFTKTDNFQKNITLCTVFPNFKILALGSYRNQCGGCDSFRVEHIASMNQGQNHFNKLSDFYGYILKILDHVDMHIIMEGLLISGMYDSYVKIFRELKEVSQREIIIYSLLPPLSVCLERIKMRRNGVPVNPEHTISKYRSVVRLSAKFAKDFKSMVVDSSVGDKKFVFDDFLRRVGISDNTKFVDKLFENDDW